MTSSQTPSDAGNESFSFSVSPGESPADVPVVPHEKGPEQSVEEMLERLSNADGGPGNDSTAHADRSVENRLAVVRLGIATSLFYALRTKHPATAAHSLRVALFCSSWSERLGLDGELRDRIEVAALLHDIGKIGIPDRILQKPGKLTVDEQLSMDTCPELGAAILQGCTDDPALLEIVRYGSSWYESRRGGDAPRGDALPLGARMLSIADAFDAMTTEHVYRPAMSCERALTELIRGTGTQFDPSLVIDFSRMLEERPEILQGTMVHRWLEQLRPHASEAFWTGQDHFAGGQTKPKEILRRETMFNAHLHRTLKDGVAFTDSEGVITTWNVAMERMTDIQAEAVIGKQWSTSALRLRDADANRDDETLCPMQQCFQTGDAVRRAMVIETPGTDPIPVHVEVAPVIGEEPGSYGTVIVVHDLSDRENLEKRLRSLHKETTLDPLTRVANRAHFDTTLDELVSATSNGGPTFSLVICDIDKFKRINDTYGHPAGDEALKTFANLLRSHSREGDLVARYGGEEFLLLAAACDNMTGARRAESIRQALECIPMPSLEGECITASFGVTEFQSGDTSATVLARADRALLKAKDNGRNRVVQLGLGKMSESQDDAPRSGWFSWLKGSDENSSTTVDIVTPVPADITIEKLRGFIADHEAEIVNVSESQLSIKVTSGTSTNGRRRIDHQISFHVVVTLSEARLEEVQLKRAAPGDATKVHLDIKPIRNRDRRRRELNDAIKLLVSSFRSYLMGEVLTEEEE